jgi:HEPN domain-containing protein
LVCFSGQQSAENYLKALLEELGQPVPRTHVLRDLLALLLPHHPNLQPLIRGVKFLTRFAASTRYPGDNATKRQAASALTWAGRVRDACRAALGLRPPRRRKRP